MILLLRGIISFFFEWSLVTDLCTLYQLNITHWEWMNWIKRNIFTGSLTSLLPYIHKNQHCFAFLLAKYPLMTISRDMVALFVRKSMPTLLRRNQLIGHLVHLWMWIVICFISLFVFLAVGGNGYKVKASVL